MIMKRSRNCNPCSGTGLYPSRGGLIRWYDGLDHIAYPWPVVPQSRHQLTVIALTFSCFLYVEVTVKLDNLIFIIHPPSTYTYIAAPPPTLSFYLLASLNPSSSIPKRITKIIRTTAFWTFATLHTQHGTTLKAINARLSSIVD